ncbi:MAG TPA: hypothetical protein VN764_12275, partial [Polyangiaceae bacterium]|nr:hypothetical protein [Polyangiaceae bacterium]
MAQQAIDQEKHALGAGAQAQREAANQPRAEGEQILPPGEAAPLLFKPPDNTNQDRPSFTRAATSDERSVWSEPSDAPDERVEVELGQLANLPMADQEKTNLLAFAVGLGLALLLGLGAYLLADWAATSGDDAALEIVASAMLTGSNDQEDLWQVQGTILESGQLVALKDVRLVVVLQDVRGNEYFGTDLSPDGAGQGQAAPHVFKFEVKQPRLLAGPDERRVDLITVR